MKSVFSNTQQAVHVWASRSQCGRNASGNVFFDRASIWSYGNHFRMAQFVTNASGSVACLINPETYSNTTSRHQCYVRRAIPSYIPTFSAPGAVLDHAATLKWYDAAMVDAMQKASRARTNAEWHLNHARDMVRTFNNYAEFFSLPERLEMPADIGSALAAAAEREKQRAERERADDIIRATKAAEQAKRDARKARDTLRKWRAGASVQLPYSARAGDVLLRVRGDVIQTSHGAEVSVEVAPMLWDRINASRLSGCDVDYIPHNVRISHFNLRTITACGDVQIGCHFIRYAELQRMAAVLGLIDTRAAA